MSPYLAFLVIALSAVQAPVASQRAAAVLIANDAPPKAMILVEPTSSEVVVARIEADGTRVVGCVDGEKAAKQFLEKRKDEQ